MGHETHRAGTAKGCKECSKLAYEPSWYATLLTHVMSGELLVELEENDEESASVSF